MARRKDQIIVWNTELDNHLKQLRSQGYNTEYIADNMGFDARIIMRRMQELGINQRIHKGSIPGHLVVSRDPAKDAAN
jgi:hypothetical protein